MTTTATTEATTTAAVTTAATTTQAATTQAEAPTLVIEDLEAEDIIAGMGDGSADAGAASEPPVATVGGLGITQSEFRYMLNSFKSDLLLNTGIEAGDEADAGFWTQTDADGRTRMDEAKMRVLDALHEIKACVLVAGERGIELDEGELENIGVDIKAQTDRFGGRESFEALLSEEYGVSLAEYWEICRANALCAKLLAAERDAIAVTDDEARAYFDEHPETYGDLVTIRRVLLLFEGDDIEALRTEEETRALAADVLARIEAGEDMEGLAAELSEDSTVVSDGGLRVVARDAVSEPEEVLEWAFEARDGDLGLVETAFGCYIIRQEDRTQRRFEDEKPAIAELLAQTELDERVAEWVAAPACAMEVDAAVFGAMGESPNVR